MNKIDFELGKMKEPALLYLVGLSDSKTDEVFIKIGITSQSIEDRFKDIPYTIEIFDIITTDGLTARAYESLLLERLLDFKEHYQPKKKISGYQECYDFSYYKKLRRIWNKVKKEINLDKPLDFKKYEKTITKMIYDKGFDRLKNHKEIRELNEVIKEQKEIMIDYKNKYEKYCEIAKSNYDICKREREHNSKVVKNYGIVLEKLINEFIELKIKLIYEEKN